MPGPAYLTTRRSTRRGRVADVGLTALEVVSSAFHYTKARTFRSRNSRSGMIASVFAFSLADCTYYTRGGGHMLLPASWCIVIYSAYTIIILGTLLGIIVAAVSRWFPQLATVDLLGWLQRWIRGE